MKKWFSLKAIFHSCNNIYTTLPWLLPKMLTSRDSLFSRVMSERVNEAARKWMVFRFRRKGAGSKIFIRLYVASIIKRYTKNQRGEARRRARIARDKDGETITRNGRVCRVSVQTHLTHPFLLALLILIPPFSSHVREFANSTSAWCYTGQKSDSQTKNAGRYVLLPLTWQERLLFVSLWNITTFFLVCLFARQKAGDHDKILRPSKRLYPSVRIVRR